MRICGLVLIVVSWGTACATAQDLPPNFLESLPKKTVSEPKATRALVECLERIDDAKQRARLLNATGRLSLKPELNDRFKAVLVKTIDDCDDAHLYTLGPAVANFPSLHAKLLERLKEPKALDIARYHFAIYSEDFRLAKQICAKISSKDRRRLALDQLAFRAPSIKESLELLQESMSLESDNPTFSGLSALNKYVAQEPKLICDFLEQFVAADDAMFPYTCYARNSSQKNPAAAQMYMDAAWARIAETARPYEHATLLLVNDYRDVDRETWVAKFDQHVLPALRDAMTEIGPLRHLARFDVDLVVDRTRKSCVHPARRYERIFPQVLGSAFFINPEAVMAWLETTDSNLKDRCTLEVVAYLPYQIDKPPSKLHMDRLGNLALAIKNPQQRLKAFGKLATASRWYGVAVSRRVMKEGQALLNQHLDLESLDFSDYDEPLALLTQEQERRFIEIQIEKFRAASDYQDQYRYGGLSRYISETGLSAKDQMVMIRKLADVAQGHMNRYVQAKISNTAASLDAPWAIKTIWSILPDDRGRSGKRTYIDWIPPPYDAGDAIRWLNQELDNPEAKVKSVVALWEFLPIAPAIDRDGIRVAICRSLNTYRQHEAVLGLAEQIESPILRFEALINLVSGLRLAQSSDQR